MAVDLKFFWFEFFEFLYASTEISIFIFPTKLWTNGGAIETKKIKINLIYKIIIHVYLLFEFLFVFYLFYFSHQLHYNDDKQITLHC